MTRQQRRAQAFERAFAQVNRDTIQRLSGRFTIGGFYAWSRSLRRAAARNMAKA